MPQAVAAAVVAAVGITGFAATIGTAVIAAAINVGVGLLVSALGSGRTKGNLTPNPVQLRDRTQQVRQPITARRVWLGEGRFSGPVIHLESTNSNKFLHIGIALATHEIAGLDTYYLDDDPIFADDLNASGLVTAGKYKNKVRIKPHLGTAAQVADADLVAESAVYTSSDRGRGVAWVYLRLEFDQKLFPSAVPNVSVVGRGSNQIADPRDASTGYSSNAVLLFNHYLTNWYDGGRGAAIPSAKVEESYTTAGANISDEVVSAKAVTHTVSAVSASDDALDLEGEVLEFFREDRVTIASTGSLAAGLPATGYVIPVRRESTSHKALRIQIAETMADARDGVAVDITDAGSGTITLTKTGEPRYRIDGGIDLDQPPATIMEDLLTAMGGVAPYIAGSWRIYPAAYRAPVEHFIDDERLRSSLKVRSRTPRRDRFNAVKGLHVSPLAFDQPDEYPLVTVAAYETADGERIVTDLDLPYTARPNAAQRLARIHLERSRREIVAEGDFDIIAMRVVAGDTIKLTHAVYGWSEKVFEVFDFDWRLQERDGQPDMVCHLRLRETDANVYAFDTGDCLTSSMCPRRSLWRWVRR